MIIQKTKEKYVCFLVDVEEAMKQEPITTGRAPVGYDPTGSVATLEDPGRGNTKNAAGSFTTAGNPKTALL